MARPNILKCTAIAMAATIAAIYIGDTAYFRVRLLRPKPADPLETYTAPRLYAIEEKGRKVEYQLDAQNPEETIICAHSLFPHGGSWPCWYTKRKSGRPIPM